MTTPSPERARLAAALRELRARTGLSLVALAAKTAFSKSSWGRYLNAGTLPPRDAVRELCRLAGEPEGRCLALWEIAESEGSGRAATDGPRSPSPASCPPSPPPPPSPTSPPSPPSPPAPPAPPSLAASPPLTASSSPPPPEEALPLDGTAPGSAHRGAAIVAVLASVCALVLGGIAAVALLLPHRDGERRASLPPPSSAAGPRCRGAVCEGQSPMRMKCAAAPATLAAFRTATGAWMELRYSEECGTSWARMWGTRVGDRIEMTAGSRDRRDDRGSRDGRVRSAEVQDDVDADAYVYTPMTAARPGAVVRACFRPAAGGAGECFDSRVAR
ncbi:helix-turn-helix domain-containing protein [Streptomyces sp. NPDC057623]|uniref:helix-turn-helix domain-containing protein n=1 Tax=Streptomyces sp. NPDC057623 TaxID=3346187 RepID=UPI0036BA7072